MARFHASVRRCALVALPAFATLSCQAGDGPGDGPVVSDVALSVSATTLTISRGGSAATAMVSITRDHYDGAVTLADSTPAHGVTATLSPTSLSGSTLSSTVTVTAARDAQGGRQPLLITLSGEGIQSKTAGIQLTVISPTVTVTKAGTGSGTVTSEPAGVDCGGACSASFFVGASVTLTAAPAEGSAFAGWSGACTGSARTCTLTLAQGSPGNVTVTFSSTAPSFALGVTPTLVSIPQGGSGRAAVSISRANGFTGAVALSVSGAPAGLAVTPSPASVTGDSATLDIAAPASLAAGNYPLRLTATGAGVAQRTAAFSVQVTPASVGSGSVALSFATCDPTRVPVWLAVQDDGGAWTRVTPGANGTFSFPVGAKTGVAYVQQDGNAFATTVTYLTRNELTSIALGNPCSVEPQTGTKVVNGTFVGVAVQPMFATVSIGGADTTFLSARGPSFTLARVPSGTRDLIAAVHASSPANGLIPLVRMIIRRNVGYGNDATVPLLAMFGAESFIPAAHFATTNNIAGDARSVRESFLTANGGASADFHSEDFGVVNNLIERYYAVPDSLLQPGDFHLIEVDAVPPVDNPGSFRFVDMLLHSATDQTITLGPPLATPAVTSLAAAPYLRPRVQLPSQSEYDGVAVAEYAQSGNSVELLASAAFFGGRPQSWTLDVPDLTSAGYDPAWGLRSGAPVDWTVVAIAGDYLGFLGAPPVDGARLVGAGRSSSSGALIQSRQAGSLRWSRRP